MHWTRHEDVGCCHINELHWHRGRSIGTLAPAQQDKGNTYVAVA